MIRQATESDIAACKRIVDAARAVFGFVTRAIFAEAVAAKLLLVATDADGAVIGFARFYHRHRDRQTTLYDIAVAASHQGQGHGRDLMHALLAECALLQRSHLVCKCPEPLPSNGFYAALGFTCIATVQGKKRALCVWQKDIIDGNHFP